MQPNRLPIALGIFLSAFFLAIMSCSNGTSDSDGNSTTPEANLTSSQEAPYQLDFCLVSGSDFGEDPDMIPYTHVYEGTTIKFCCKPCLPKFEKNPEKYMADLKEEIEALAKEAKE